jgi:hypothetical protein
MNKGGTRPKQGANANANAAAKIKELTKKVDNLSMSVKQRKAKGPGMFAGFLGKAGTALGAGISRVAGFGDYTVMDNTMSRGGYSSVDVPMFGGSGSSEVRVTHREFVKTISVPSDGTKFQNFTMDINPSNESMFPWLSKIAKNYQQYKINGMVITFKSMTSEYTSAGALGTVGIATNYNVNDLPYSDLVSFENSQFAVVNKPSLNIVHAIECKEFARNGLQLYVRDASSESTQVSDPRFYDFAKVQIMTEGLPQEANSTLGQLWVSYDITLLKPVVSKASVAPPSVPRTVLRSQKDTTALQWLDNGDIYTDMLTWPNQPTTAGAYYTSFSTNSGLEISSEKADTFSRTPTELTLISPSDSGGLLLRKNGHYKFVFNTEGVFSSEQIFVSGERAYKDFNVTDIGTAVSTSVYERAYSVLHTKYSHSAEAIPVACGVLEIVVSGITSDGAALSGGVEISLASWLLYNNQSAMASGLIDKLQVTWSDHAVFSG